MIQIPPITIAYSASSLLLTAKRSGQYHNILMTVGFFLPHSVSEENRTLTHEFHDKGYIGLISGKEADLTSKSKTYDVSRMVIGHGISIYVIYHILDRDRVDP